MNYFSTLSW